MALALSSQFLPKTAKKRHMLLNEWSSLHQQWFWCLPSKWHWLQYLFSGRNPADSSPVRRVTNKLGQVQIRFIGDNLTMRVGLIFLESDGAMTWRYESHIFEKKKLSKNSNKKESLNHEARTKVSMFPEEHRDFTVFWGKTIQLDPFFWAPARSNSHHPYGSKPEGVTHLFTS